MGLAIGNMFLLTYGIAIYVDIKLHIYILHNSCNFYSLQDIPYLDFACARRDNQNCAQVFDDFISVSDYYIAEYCYV